MNGELPLIAVAGAGSAMLGGIHLRERAADEAMRRTRQRWRIEFPADVDPVFAKASLLALAGGDWRQEFAFSVEAARHRVQHFVYIPSAVRHTVFSALTGALPGVQLTEDAEPTGRATLSVKLHFSRPLVLADGEPEAVVRTLLAGIADLGQGEFTALRVAARPATPPPWQPAEPPDRAAREAERRWQQKISSGAGFDASGLIVVRAGSIRRAREICDHLTSVLRSRRGPVGAIKVTMERGNRSLASLPKTTRSSGWLTAGELLGPVLAWPIGNAPMPGVTSASRTLLAPRSVPHTGISLFVGRDGQGERPVAISPELLRQHLLIIGKSGSGKSTLSATVILSMIEQGFAVCLIDPKSDTFDAVLRRVPKEQAHRIAVIDPGDTRRPLPGLNLMTAGDSPDLRADALTGAIRSAFPAEA